MDGPDREANRKQLCNTASITRSGACAFKRISCWESRKGARGNKRASPRGTILAYLRGRKIA